MFYDDAVEFMDQRRNIEPPIYNNNRLKEFPIPNINIQDNREENTQDDEDSEVSIASIAENHQDSSNLQNEDNSSGNNVDANGSIETQSGIDEIETTVDFNIDENSNDGDPLLIVASDVEVKYGSIELVSVHAGNSGAIDGLLDEPEIVNYDEDVVILIGQHGLPKPKQYTNDNLLKREGDEVTGTMPYNITVSY